MYRLEPLCFIAIPDIILDVYVEAPLMPMDSITSALRALQVAPAAELHLSLHLPNLPAARSTFELAPRPAPQSTRQLALRSVVRPKVQPAPKPVPQTEPQAASHTAPQTTLQTAPRTTPQIAPRTASHSSLQSPPPSPPLSESQPGKTSPPSQSAQASAQPKGVNKPSRNTTIVDEDEESTFVIVQSNAPSVVTSTTTGNTQPVGSNSANAKSSGGTLSQDELHLSAKEKMEAGTNNDTDTLISAKARDVHTQLKLAEAYRDGKGGYRQNYLAAKGWFILAAQQEDSTAQYNIGLFYEEGHGVEKDSSMAAFWYDKAAHNGSAKAQSNLGILYIKGDGVEKNNALAIQWLVMAAKQGNASAQFNLGCMYYRGEGVPVNHDKATAWFSKAAKGGHAPALQACKDIQDERPSPGSSS